jgi:hypothetical protein
LALKKARVMLTFILDLNYPESEGLHAAIVRLCAEAEAARESR